MAAYVANPFYQALTTANAQHALGGEIAVRYQPDIIPFGAVAEPSPEAMSALRNLLAPGESLFTTGENFPAVDGLLPTGKFPGLQMHYDGEGLAREEAMEVVTLSLANSAEMLALKAVAFPGYFHKRAPVLGDFFGIRDADGRLIAMGGERLSLPMYREISAVCTHPDYVGKGYGAKLIRAVMRTQAARGAHSMLHVLCNNTCAITLYEHLGFVTAGPVCFQRFECVRSEL